MSAGSILSDFKRSAEQIEHLQYELGGKKQQDWYEHVFSRSGENLLSEILFCFKLTGC